MPVDDPYDAAATLATLSDWGSVEEVWEPAHATGAWTFPSATARCVATPGGAARSTTDTHDFSLPGSTGAGEPTFLTAPPTSSWRARRPAPTGASGFGSAWRSSWQAWPATSCSPWRWSWPSACWPAFPLRRVSTPMWPWWPRGPRQQQAWSPETRLSLSAVCRSTVPRLPSTPSRQPGSRPVRARVPARWSKPTGDGGPRRGGGPWRQLHVHGRGPCPSRPARNPWNTRSSAPARWPVRSRRCLSPSVPARCSRTRPGVVGIAALAQDAVAQGVWPVILLRGDALDVALCGG